MASSLQMPATSDMWMREDSRSKQQWKRAGRVVMAVAGMADRLHSSTVLGAGGVGVVIAQSGYKRHSMYLSKLRRGVRIATVLNSGAVHQRALAHERALEQSLAISQGQVIMEATTAAELEAIPMYMQGDANLATTEKMEQRQKLRFDRRVGEVLHEWWEAALGSVEPIENGRGEADTPSLSREGHAMMLQRVYRVMLKDFDAEDCSRSIAEDWAHDSKGMGELQRRAFGDAFFELAYIPWGLSNPRVSPTAPLKA